MTTKASMRKQIQELRDRADYMQMMTGSKRINWSGSWVDDRQAAHARAREDEGTSPAGATNPGSSLAQAHG